MVIIIIIIIINWVPHYRYLTYSSFITTNIKIYKLNKKKKKKAGTHVHD